MTSNLQHALNELRHAGKKAELRDYIYGHVVEPLLAKSWVQRMSPSLRDEYLSQLATDLDKLLDRLSRNDVPASGVLRVARAEFKFTRQHMYAFSKTAGNRGKRKANHFRPRQGGSNPRARDREFARTPIYDDPTVSQIVRDPSAPKHVGYADTETSTYQLWATLRDDIERLRPYCLTDRERELWMALWLWTDRFIIARMRYVDAKNLINQLKTREAACNGLCATGRSGRLFHAA
jgi:hypothetical protein